MTVIRLPLVAINFCSLLWKPANLPGGGGNVGCVRQTCRARSVADIYLYTSILLWLCIVVSPGPTFSRIFQFLFNRHLPLPTPPPRSVVVCIGHPSRRLNVLFPVRFLRVAAVPTALLPLRRCPDCNRSEPNDGPELCVRCDSPTTFSICLWSSVCSGYSRNTRPAKKKTKTLCNSENPVKWEGGETGLYTV